MIDFGKLWTTLVFINIAILLANFTGIFPEQWSPYLKGLKDNYVQIQDELKTIQNISEGDILQYFGAYGYLILLGLKITIQVVVLAPYYVSVTLNQLFASLGLPIPIGTAFMLISYFSFVLFIIDVIRGRMVDVGY